MEAPTGIIDIPTIDDLDLLERNQERAENKGLDSCPCCGKGIENPRYFINSIYGGCAYPGDDDGSYNDAWQMAVGPECRKKFPDGYVFEQP